MMLGRGRDFAITCTGLFLQHAQKTRLVMHMGRRMSETIRLFLDHLQRSGNKPLLALVFSQ